MSITIDDVMKT